MQNMIDAAPRRKVSAGAFRRRERVKEYLRSYWTSNHYSPSVREIATEFNTSTSVVNTWLDRLERDGWLEARRESIARNIVPVEIFRGRDVIPNEERVLVKMKIENIVFDQPQEKL